MPEWFLEWFMDANPLLVGFVALVIWTILYGLVRLLYKRLGTPRGGVIRQDPYALMKLEADNAELREKLAIYESPESVESRLLRVERMLGVGGYRDPQANTETRVRVLDEKESHVGPDYVGPPPNFEVRTGVRLEDTMPGLKAFLEVVERGKVES